jgi:hypothetical protein
MMVSAKITMRAAKMYMVTDDTKRSTKTNQDCQFVIIQSTVSSKRQNPQLSP